MLPAGLSSWRHSTHHELGGKEGKCVCAYLAERCEGCGHQHKPKDLRVVAVRVNESPDSEVQRRTKNTKPTPSDKLLAYV